MLILFTCFDKYNPMGLNLIKKIIIIKFVTTPNLSTTSFYSSYSSICCLCLLYEADIMGFLGDVVLGFLNCGHCTPPTTTTCTC